MMKLFKSMLTISESDYEKAKQEIWEENWNALKLYSIVSLFAFGLITIISIFSLSIGKIKWVYLVYALISVTYFFLTCCEFKNTLTKKIIVYSFFTFLLSFGIITGTLITPEELTVNYLVFLMTAPLLFTTRTKVMNEIILGTMLLYIVIALYMQHNPILTKNIVNVILYGTLSMFLTALMMKRKLQRVLYHKEVELLEINKREAQEKKLNYERFLTDMVRYSASEENPDKVLNQLVQYIGENLQADRAYIFEQNEHGTFDNTYEWCKEGVSKEKDNLQDVPYEGVIETWYVQFQKFNNIIINDIEEYKNINKKIYNIFKPQGVKSLVTGPIKINGKMVGFYGVDNPPSDKLNEVSDQINMIEFMISFMMKLRENADVLEHSALYDQLTDCKNRKALDWAYADQIDKYLPLALVMCDLNGLKEINDEKGHDVGDRYIVQSTKTLRTIFGKQHVYRIGGDEFVVVLPNITPEAFKELIEAANEKLSTTFSFGTAISNTTGTDFESLLKTADAKMYQNKKQYYNSIGKDRRKTI